MKFFVGDTMPNIRGNVDLGIIDTNPLMIGSFFAKNVKEDTFMIFDRIMTITNIVAHGFDYEVPIYSGDLTIEGSYCSYIVLIYPGNEILTIPGSEVIKIETRGKSCLVK